MKKISIHFKPSFTLRAFHIIFLIVTFLILYYWVNQLEVSPNSTNLAEGIFVGVVSIAYVFIMLKSDIIFTPKKYLKMDEYGLCIEDSKGRSQKYEWSKIKEINLIFKDYRLYFRIGLFDEKNIEFELTEKWFYSAFNSFKTVKYNHQKLMSYFGYLKEFTGRIETQYYAELLEVFRIPPPEWLINNKS